MSERSTAYSILELAIVSRGSTLEETFANARSLAQQAEADGYTRFWLAEHHNSVSVGSSAPPILIGNVADATTTLRVGSGGVMLPNHSPLVVAEQFGTLGALYPDRIDLGLGRAPGTDPETARAIRADFIQGAHSFPRDIGQIQQYFSESNESSKVRATVAEGVAVPIYILGSSTDSAHLAAAKGLPYAFASHFAPMQLMRALHIYRDEFTPSEQLERPYTMAAINVYLADTQEEAERQFTSLIRMFVGLITGNRDYLSPPTEMNAEMKTWRDHPRVQQMLQCSFVGTKESVKQDVKDFIDKTGVDELIVSAGIYEHGARLRSFRLFAELMKELNAA